MNDLSAVTFLLSKMESFESQLRQLAAVARQSPDPLSSVEISHNSRGITFAVKTYAESVDDACADAQRIYDQLQQQYAEAKAAETPEPTLVEQLQASVEQIKARKANGTPAHANVSALGPRSRDADDGPEPALEVLPFLMPRHIQEPWLKWHCP